MHLLSNILFLIVFFVYADVASSHETETLFNQVHVQAQAERDIPNDEMQTLLVSEHQGKNASDLSRRVNEDVKWAISIAKKNKDIEVSTRAYQTYPIYKDRDVVAWRVSQELQLKSKNMAELSEVIGELQEKLQVRQMQFSASKQTRDEIENELIEEAMQVFKRRAAIIKKHMEEKDYRIVNLHVNSNGQQPQMMHAQRNRVQAMEMASAPTVEAGTSKITVTVSGSVQFF
ncbi:MAG: putative secreted protein [Planctomycetota bacterium]|jgi:predicted secreted protein